jgi:hypothetical protein
MKIDPKGSIPPSMMMASGSMNHFFSGMGLGTALTLHGWSGVPLRFLPRTVPTRVRGRITKKQMQETATIVPNGMALKD